jgi:hypothetical protein
MRYARVSSVLLALCLLTALPVFAGDGAIPIWEPTTITEPGKYILTRNISAAVSGGAVITIQTDDVQLNLDGHTVENTSPGDPTILLDPTPSYNIYRMVIHDGTVLCDYECIVLPAPYFGESMLFRNLMVRGTGYIGSGGGVNIDGCNECRFIENQVAGIDVPNGGSNTFLENQIGTLSMREASNLIERNRIGFLNILYNPAGSDLIRGNTVGSWSGNGASAGDNYYFSGGAF